MTPVIVDQDDGKEFCNCDEPDVETEAGYHESGWNLPPGGFYVQPSHWCINCDKPMPPDYEPETED